MSIYVTSSLKDQHKLPKSVTPNELIINQIYFIREQKVMLDRDLAALYGVETKHLKRQVNRNINRFPEGLMFKMNAPEFKNWRYQFGTSNSEKMGLRYAPFCFTELGVAMLSSVLHSDKAIGINIQIMLVFAEMRKMLMDNSELRIAIEEIRKKTDNNVKNIEVVFQYLDELIEKKEKKKTLPKKPLGYRIKRPN